MRRTPVITEAPVLTATVGCSARAQEASLDQCVKSTSTNATRLRAVMAPRVRIKLTALNASVPRESLDSAVKVGLLCQCYMFRSALMFLPYVPNICFMSTI